MEGERGGKERNGLRGRDRTCKGVTQQLEKAKLNCKGWELVLLKHTPNLHPLCLALWVFEDQSCEKVGTEMI